MRFLRAWDRFWFEPRETVTIGVVRLLIGLLVFSSYLLLAPYTGLWFTDQGAVRVTTELAYNGPWHFSILMYFRSATAAWALMSVVLLASLSLTVGFLTRLSAVICYICLLSFDHRNLVILNSGDTMLKMLVFYLTLAPAGASLSIDSWLRRRDRHPDRPSGKASRVLDTSAGRLRSPIASEDEESKSGRSKIDRARRWLWDEGICGCPGPLAAPWAQRLIQFQIATVYVSTALWKLQGVAWRSGTAMWIVSHLVEMHRFPFPGFLSSPFFINVQTWFALFAEFAMGVLVWVPFLRLPALFLGVVLHLGIEWSMNIPQFATIMVSSYVAFLDVPHIFERFKVVCTGWEQRRTADRTEEERLRPGEANSRRKHGNGSSRPNGLTRSSGGPGDRVTPGRKS